MPALKAKGITKTDDIVREISGIVTNRTGANLLATYVMQRDVINRSAERNRSAMGLDETYQTAKSSAQGKELETAAKWHDLKTVVGAQVLPVYAQLLDKVNALMAAFIRFGQSHPTVVKWLGIGAITALGLVGAFTAVAAAIAAVAAPFVMLNFGALQWVKIVSMFGQGGSMLGFFGQLGGKLNAVMTVLPRLINLLKMGFIGIGRALMANPILLAVGLIIGALYLLWRHWDTVKSVLIRGWQAIQQTFSRYPILNFIFPIIGAARLILNNWSRIAPWFAQLWQHIKAYCSQGIGSLILKILTFTPLTYFIRVFDPLWAWLASLVPKMLAFGSNLINGLINGIQAQFPALAGMWGRIRSTFDGNMVGAAPAATAKPKGYAWGGYTGNGARDAIAGIVHAGEVVFSQADVARFGGWQQVERLRTGGIGALGGLLAKGGALMQSALASRPNFMGRMLSRVAEGGHALLDAIAPPAAAPALAFQGASGSSNTYNITINAPSGNGQDIAATVRRVLEDIGARQSRAARSRYQDKD